jgi:RNA polymerase sigma-70 factor (ECF subfamily)
MSAMTGIRPAPDGEPRSTARATGHPADDERSRLAALLRTSARGDESAFAALYDATAARVRGLVLRVIRDPAQADEVTQEVFLEVWRQCARYDEAAGSPLAWMMTIAHRRSVDRVRSAEASSRRDSTYEHRTRETEHDQTAETATGNLEARRVRAALGTLTEAQREAIGLAYFGGYTHTEVATLLDLPLGTAKTRIRDGLIRLRDTLGVEA